VRFQARSNQSGFALIEVIASAAVLGLVTIAVYGGYNATLGSSGRERARAVAASLAEQDQERLRSFRPTDLATYAAPPRIVKVPAVTGPSYTIESTVDWISDTANGVASCTSDANLEDYLRITSKVTSAIVGDAIKPVVQRSLVAPPVGTFRQGLGSLVVRVSGKGTLPIQNLPVTIQKGSGTPITRNTNSFGCAVFRYVPIGSYSVRYNEPGYVDQSGATSVVSSGTVSEGTLNVVPVTYDRGATVTATFDTQHRGTTCTPPGCPASKGMGITLESADIPATSRRTFPTGGTNQSVAQDSITTALLYPFNSAYGVYSGFCTDASPQKMAPPVALGLAKSPNGLDPGQSFPILLRQPALNIRVINGSVAGVPVPIMGKRITAQPKTGDCATGLKYQMVGYTGTGALDLNAGWASKSSTPYDPGLPYGQYDVCVDNGVTSPNASRHRSKDLTVIVNLYNPAGSTPKTVDLNDPAQYSSGSGASGQCPA
jgi:Tfp pilus assembly protein PilE